MAWRLAGSLETLRSQVNARWPNRAKGSDGTKGDDAHAARQSDHNPDDRGIVHALDLTHDPKSGFDSFAFADLLLKKQDKRLRYVISNSRIGSGPDGPSPGVWRPYRVPPNKNPHEHHCHVSCVYGAGEDDTRPWGIDGSISPSPDIIDTYVPPPPTLRKGDRGPQVQTVQGRLNAHGANLKVDGDFGPLTTATLKGFQKQRGLVDDGICGPMTWAALLK